MIRFFILSALVVLIPTAAGNTVFVNGAAAPNGDGASWATAFSDLQDALADPRDDLEIWVAAGTYRPTVSTNETPANRNASFALRDGVMILGGFEGTEAERHLRRPNRFPTILSGELGNGHFSYHVVTSVGNNDTAVLDGFTITRGRADNDGGMTAESDPESLVNGNPSAVGGGCVIIGGAPVVRSCVFQENSARLFGGAVCVVSGSPTFENCVFTGNTVTGAGVTGVGGLGGAMFFLNNGNSGFPAIVSSVFSGNTAAGFGGAIYAYASNPVLAYCTLAQNMDSGPAGAIYSAAGASPEVLNCIIWGHSNVENTPGIVTEFPSVSRFEHNLIQHSGGSTHWDLDLGLDGGGNIELDPRFVDNNNAAGADGIVGTADDGLRLASGSPCIDTAVTIPGIVTDMLGLNRPQNGNSDVGAYEFDDDDSHRYVVSGSIEYSGDLTGAVVVELWRNAEFVGAPELSQQVQDGVMTFSFSGVFTGTYYVQAYSDTDENSRFEPPEALGRGDQPVIVTADVAGLSVVLTDRPRVLFVDAVAKGAGTGMSWDDAFTDLAAALAAAVVGQQLWVAGSAPTSGDRIYRPTAAGDRDASFVLKSGVNLYGGFSGDESHLSDRLPEQLYTILSGDLSANDSEATTSRLDNSYHVVIGADGAVLDGFIITGGHADGPTQRSRGGGLYNNGASPTIVNTVFISNHAVSFGGGVFNLASEPRIADCAFDRNIAGEGGGGIANVSAAPNVRFTLFSGNLSPAGGAVFNQSCPPDLTIVGCRFTQNGAADRNDGSGGGAVYNSQSSPVVSFCRILGNAAVLGGGIFNIFDANPLITNCVFSDNVAFAAADTAGGGDGGAVLNHAGSSAAFRHCLFRDNSADRRGSAVSSSNASSPTFVNCTFFANRSLEGVVLATLDTSQTAVANCILWSNTTTAGADSDMPITGADVEFSIVQGLVDPSGSNIGLDPEFVDPDRPDGDDNEAGTADDGLRLASTSPGRNAGDDLDTPGSDIAGTIRPQEAAVDIGAFEYFEPVAVGGRIWVDTNGNGIRSSGEAETFDGAVVQLFELIDSGEGDLEPLLVSTAPDVNSTGEFEFADLNPRLYFINVSLPPGIGFSLRGQGDDPERDSDINPDTGASDGFVIVSGEDAEPIDIGLVPASLDLVIEQESVELREGNGVTLQLRLSGPPVAPVTAVVVVESGNPNAFSVAHETLLFSPENWNVPQVIMLTADEDENVESETVTLRFEAPSSLNPVTPAVTVVTAIDNDISVMAPTAADRWVIGTMREIAWVAPPLSTVHIDVSRDGGDTWASIVATTPAAAPGMVVAGSGGNGGQSPPAAGVPGSFVWQIAGPTSLDCRIRVRDAAGGSAIGTSATGFGIVARHPSDRWFVNRSADGDNNGVSWEHAFRSLEAAFGDAVAGDSVWVAAGVYRPAEPGGLREATFLLPGNVSVFGGFDGAELLLSQRNPADNVTRLTGDLNDDDADDSGLDDNSYHVLRASADSDGAVLDGFVIESGNAAGVEPHDIGGGMRIESGLVTIQNCTFVGNAAANRGGGVYVGLGAAAEFTNCLFWGNVGNFGGGVAVDGAMPMIAGCRFVNNHAFAGGGLYTTLAAPVIADSVFRDNVASLGAAVFNDTGSGAAFVNVVIDRNFADGDGAAMANNACSPIITNCTLTDNFAVNRTGGIYNENASPAVTNCILWSNSDSDGDGISAQISIFGNTDIAASSNIAQGLQVPDTEGNIGADPRFANASNPEGTDGIFLTADDGLQLGPGSPAIDVGDADAPGVSATDAIGQPRYDDLAISNAEHDSTETIIDLGAYERQSDSFISILASVSQLAVPEGGSGIVRLRLEQPPFDDIVLSIAVEGEDDDIVVSDGATLTFGPGNWNIDQLVTITAAEDDDRNDGAAVLRVTQLSGGITVPAIAIPLTEVDDEIQVTFTTDGNGTTTPAGAVLVDVAGNLAEFMVTATPNPGFAFNGWTSSVPVIFDNVSSPTATVFANSDVVITASFKELAPLTFVFSRPAPHEPPIGENDPFRFEWTIAEHADEFAFDLYVTELAPSEVRTEADITSGVTSGDVIKLTASSLHNRGPDERTMYNHLTGFPFDFVSGRTTWSIFVFVRSGVYTDTILFASETLTVIGREIVTVAIDPPNGDGVIHVGESVNVTATVQTEAGQNLSGPGAIVFHNPDGSNVKTFNRPTSNGSLELFNRFVATEGGEWSIEVIWPPDDAVELADYLQTRATRAFSVAPSATVLKVNHPGFTLKFGDQPTISGTIELRNATPADVDLSGLGIDITIVGPDGSERDCSDGNGGTAPCVTTTVAQDFTTSDLFSKRIHRFELPAALTGELFDESGVWQLRADFAGNASLAPSQSALLELQVRDSRGYAILVLGSTDDLEGIDEHRRTLEYVEDVLLAAGLAQDDILWIDETNATPKADLKNAIEVWAQQRMLAAPAPLNIVLVNHGDVDVVGENNVTGDFHMHPDLLTSDELNAMITNLESSLPAPAANATVFEQRPIIITLGMCYSGSFIGALSKPDGRIVIASATAAERSVRGPGTAEDRQGEYFVYLLYRELSRGRSLLRSFRRSTRFIRELTDGFDLKLQGVPDPFPGEDGQHPLLDDNGDHVGSVATTGFTGDGRLANRVFLVAEATVEVPEVAPAKPSILLEHGDVMTGEKILFAAVDDPNIVQMLMEVREPTSNIANVTGTASMQAALNLRSVVLARTGNADFRFAEDDMPAERLFDAPGLHTVLLHALGANAVVGAGDAQTSEPGIVRVYRAPEGGVKPSPFNLLGPGDNANIEFLNNHALFTWDESEAQDDATVSYIFRLWRSPGESELQLESNPQLANAVFFLPSDLPSGQFWWDVVAVDDSGNFRVSQSKRKVNILYTNPEVPGFLFGKVEDQSTGELLAVGTVIVTSGEMEVARVDLANGFYATAVNESSYDAEAVVGGFFPGSKSSIQIIAGEATEQNFTLTGDTSVAIPLTTGWNLIATPIEPEKSAVEEIFSGATEDTAWMWTQHQFESSLSLTSGFGYWFLSDVEDSFPIEDGEPPEVLTRDCHAGWNLIGLKGTNEIVFTDSGIVGKVWFWDHVVERYVPIPAGGKLAAGTGYWVYLKSAKTITLGAN